ncbi:hypothetical protein [Dinghuibacter silviterrae]|uniref:Uncharacterized protein n=1 Tax=Dinghuibacter silviterrae TaxID=1539049 RepID=A0A4R8DQP4_9BACT|nr:hypothetical protein [Dinghuibacter silviterrae]TDX00474.1 hypothetical protein EDB95_1499 [Dinghuibacter silviterrae]
MKMTKLFIAGVCLLAAGIGVAATKAHTKTSFTYYYETTVGSPSTCATVVLSTDPVCVTTAQNACDVTINSTIGTRQLFLSENILGDCITPLTKQ